MYAPSLAQCLSAASLWALVRSDTLEICSYGIRVVALQPVEIICRGVTSTTTITRTYTVPPLPEVTSIIDLPPVGIITTTVTGDEPGTETIPPSPGCTDCTSTIRITTVPSVPAIITTSVPGLTPGTETIPPPTGCTSDCTSTVRITTVPPVPGLTTTTVPGITPGTETIPPPAACTSDCTSTVRITTVPPGLTTTTVPGTVPGTETIPPTSGCISDCTSTIRITTVPPVPGLTTTTVPGTVPGTETLPPTSGCTSDCTSTIRITTVPPISTGITTTVPGTVPGTETIPPPSGCTDCTTTVRITTVPSPTPSPEPPSPPPGACFFTPGSCDPSSGSLSLNLYENSAQAADGYAVSDGQSGVGPDYYLDQQPIDQGSTQSLSVPAGDNDDATGGFFNPQPPDSRPVFNYYPGLTKSYGGMRFDANNFTIVFTGYFVPETTGTHTFCVNFADNRNPLYIGSDDAFPCGDASNGATPRGATPRADYWFARETEAQCADVEMVAGFHYPLRQVYGNWGTPSSLAVTVQGPGEEATSDVAGRVSNADCTSD